MAKNTHHYMSLLNCTEPLKNVRKRTQGPQEKVSQGKFTAYLITGALIRPSVLLIKSHYKKNYERLEKTKSRLTFKWAFQKLTFLYLASWLAIRTLMKSNLIKLFLFHFYRPIHHEMLREMPTNGNHTVQNKTTPHFKITGHPHYFAGLL